MNRNPQEGVMREYYIEANSFPAPFVADPSARFVVAESPVAALERFAAEYTHPAGLYAARCYTDANACVKGEKPLARWLSNHARQAWFHERPASFAVNDQQGTEDSKAGSIDV